MELIRRRAVIIRSMGKRSRGQWQCRMIIPDTYLHNMSSPFPTMSFYRYTVCLVYLLIITNSNCKRKKRAQNKKDICFGVFHSFAYVFSTELFYALLTFPAYTASNSLSFCFAAGLRCCGTSTSTVTYWSPCTDGSFMETIPLPLRRIFDPD